MMKVTNSLVILCVIFQLARSNLECREFQRYMFEFCAEQGKIPYMTNGDCFHYGTPALCEEKGLLFMERDVCSTVVCLIIY